LGKILDNRLAFAEALYKACTRYIAPNTVLANSASSPASSSARVQAQFLTLLTKAKGGSTHAGLAEGMKMTIDVFTKNPIDENWAILVEIFRDFYKKLQAADSQKLLASVNNVIEKSAFPNIGTHPYIQIDADALQKIPIKFFEPSLSLIKNKPDPRAVMSDICRDQSQYFIEVNGEVKKFNDMVRVTFEEKNGKSFYHVYDENNIDIYDGSKADLSANLSEDDRMAKDASNAIMIIQETLASYFPLMQQDMIKNIVPFLSQQGVLQQQAVHLVLLLTVGAIIDLKLQGMDDGYLKQFQNCEKLTEGSMDAICAVKLMITTPQHALLLSVNNEGVNIQQRYLFTQYVWDGKAAPLAPIECTEQCNISVSEDGKQATMHYEQKSLAFEATSKTPEEAFSHLLAPSLEQSTKPKQQ
jgi:hypothetical protein